MLKDIPYVLLKQNERAYEIMLLCDQHSNTFSDTAKEFGLSVSRIRQIYNGLKIKQKRLYINHISIVLGYDDCTQVEEIYNQAYEFYQSRTYACAYLEIKYREILAEYRKGEPGMPVEFIDNMPPLRDELTAEETEHIIKMREEKKQSFAETADELHITSEKAEEVYDRHYRTKTFELMHFLQDKAKSRQEKDAIWDYCINNSYSSKRRYDMINEKFMKDLKEKR